jgi:hypothetical protein
LDYFLLFAASVFVFGGFVHSIVGEKLLVIPLLQRELPKFLGSERMARDTVRMAWHLTTVWWLGVAGLLVVLATPGVDLRLGIRWVLIGTCAASALNSFVFTRGKHVISWAGSGAAGVAILLST